jgi:capsule polysaccharide export protein KpsE/RkpR
MNNFRPTSSHLKKKEWQHLMIVRLFFFILVAIIFYFYIAADDETTNDSNLENSSSNFDSRKNISIPAPLSGQTASVITMVNKCSSNQIKKKQKTIHCVSGKDMNDELVC